MDDLLDAFEQLRIAPEEFDHAAHVRVAYAMITRDDFVSACAKYAVTLRAMAARAGAPEKFNATVTFAFMSMIAEYAVEVASYDELVSQHPELLSAGVLERWYSAERLGSPLARRQFLLPDR